MATLAANRHPKATHQWLLMGAQVCRLPALKRSKRSKRSKRLKPSKHLKPSKQPPPATDQSPRHTSMASCGHSCSQQAPQGHTSMASYGRPRLPFASPKTLQTLQTLKTLKTLQTNPSCSHQAISIASAVCQP